MARGNDVSAGTQKLRLLSASSLSVYLLSVAKGAKFMLCFHFAMHVFPVVGVLPFTFHRRGFFVAAESNYQTSR